LNFEVRPGGEDDQPSLATIQLASRAAAQWDVREYFRYDLQVAECEGRVVGFAVARRVAEGESELLNLAVDPGFRRRGIGGRLVRELLSKHSGTLWLEVRESNWNARNLYKKLGFIETAKRPAYYPESGESAIVMNIHS